MEYILTINGGSSSVKFALFEAGGELKQISVGKVQRLSVVDSGAYGRQAADGLLEWLKPIAELKDIAAIGHRIVHGGPKYLEHVQITPEVLDELRSISPIDPDHLPGEIALIEAMGKYFPGVPQVACFDTVFHRDMPQVAKLLPIPKEYGEQGVRRYGFHGLSYAYLMEELGRQQQAAGSGQQAALDHASTTGHQPPAASHQQRPAERVILAHLGNGCSMAAVNGGKSIDTTMAFTPTAGLMMGTRCGDLDPGVLVYLMRQEKMDADQIDALVNKKSGLLGVSGISSDMRDLLAKQTENPQAVEAVELFCYMARKWVGALAAALNGLDTLVFSGGIGENAAEVRSRICSGLEHLGVQIDAVRNNERDDAKAEGGGLKAEGRIISADDAQVTVRVIPTDEEIMIARIVERIVFNR
jgi:acetate kinase